MRTLKFVIPGDLSGRRLDSILKNQLHLSAHRLSSLKFSGGIFVDGENVHTSYTVRAGQTVSVQLKEQGTPVAPCSLPVHILFQDEDMLIVDKPAPLPAIASARQSGTTLENALFSLLNQPGDFVYRPVSRLDKGTSGLMPVAMNAVAHDRMQRMLHTGNYIREYLAVTETAPQADSGTINAPIGHFSGVKRAVMPGGKPSVTHFQVLKRADNGRALLRLRLETGRTHQIRVHLSHIGCPIVGDYLYGTESPVLPGRFALHAARISILHPMTGERLQFESPLPDALSVLLDSQR